MTRDDCVNNAAAYALGALEAREATEYERHLRTCAVCHDEVAILQGVADALAMATPQYRVPADLRRRVVGTVRAESRRRRRIALRRAPAPALAGAGAVALAAVVVVIAIIASHSATRPRLVHAMVRGSEASAELRITGNRAELVVHRLPAPPAGRIYEVWLKRPGGAPMPTRALFGVTAGGAADVGVPGELSGVSEVLVTQEPAGGGLVPTGPAVIVARTS
jgi:anti-sigma-K factor RskA